jgi:hypothetical protein
MPSDQFTSRLEPLLKVGAASVAVIYAIGYMIVSVHHAMFAIAQFDPFRPKIVLTGLIFVILTAIPTIAAFRMLGLTGLRGSIGMFIPAEPQHRQHLKVVLCIDFYALCTVLARYAGFLFGSYSDTRPSGIPLLIACLVAYAGLGLAMRKHFDRNPRVFILLTVIVTAGLFLATLFFEDRKLFGMSLWFYAIGLFSALTFTTIKDSQLRTTAEWERDFAVVAAVILVYSTMIYSNIVPYFGGRRSRASDLLLSIGQ